MKRPRDKQGRRIPRHELRKQAAEKRVQEMMRFTRDWMENHPPRFDPRNDPMKGEEQTAMGETRYVHHIAYGPDEQVPPTIAIPLRTSPTKRFADLHLRSQQHMPIVRFRRVPWRWQASDTVVYFDSWEAIDGNVNPPDEQKFKEVRAAADVVGLSNMMLSYMHHLFGHNHRTMGPELGACMEWLERLQIAARVWLGDPPMVQDKPRYEDMQRYQWWLYATDDFDQRKWR